MTKIQTRLEEVIGKEAPSKPLIRARLNKIEDMLAAMNDCIRIYQGLEMRSPIKRRAVSWSFIQILMRRT